MEKTDDPRRVPVSSESASAPETGSGEQVRSQHLRNANEQLVIAMVRADEEIAKRKQTEVILSETVRELREAKDKLQEKNDELEKFMDVTVDRELKLIQAEQECEALKRECETLKSKLTQLRAERDKDS